LASERYINRALPDGELEDFVEAFARRLSNFDKRAIAEVKKLIDGPTLPSLSEFQAGMEAYFVSATRPETRARIGAAISAGLQRRGDVELNLGRYVGRGV